MTSDRPRPRGDRLARIPVLLRFLGLHLILGAALGAAFASVVASSNAIGLRDLLLGTEQPLVALLMLYAMNILTFGSLAMGAGIMLLPRDMPGDMPEQDERTGNDGGPGSG